MNAETNNGTEVDDRPYVVGFVSSPHPHSTAHMQTLDVLNEVSEIHICGLEGEDVEALAALSSKVRSTTGAVQDLVSRPDVDALMVSVRNDLCPAVLQAAIAAGKPVLFEKPGALSASDLRSIADSARERGVTMGAMYTNRLSPIIQEVRQLRLDGAFGRVMAVEARWVTSQVRYRDPSHWLFSRATAGSGILSWLGCHYIDALCFMLDERIVEVSAMVGRQNPEAIEVEDTACLAIRFASGVLGTLHAGYHMAGSPLGYHGGTYDMFLAVRGTDGYATLPLSDGSHYTLLSVAPGWSSGGKRERSFAFPESSAYGGQAGEEFVLSFLRASRTGGSAPAPIEAAVHVLEVVEAALESSSTGRAVKIA